MIRVAALRCLGATGRQIAALAAPIGDPVEVPAAQRQEPPAQRIDINITLKIITDPEESPWLIQ